MDRCGYICAVYSAPHTEQSLTSESVQGQMDSNPHIMYSNLLQYRDGVYAFARRDIERYMLMLDHFVFFDFDEPIIFFIADYIAVMGLFVFVGHYLSDGIRHGIKR